MTNMPPNVDIDLPHRRMEAWKWTDVRGAASSQAGLSSEGTLDLSVPDSVSLSRGDGHTTPTVMGTLAKNFAGQSHNIYVPSNASPEEPIYLSGMSAGHASMSIMVDKGASVTLIEDYSGASGAFMNLDIHIHLAEGAKLTRIVTQNDPNDTLRVVTACVAVERNASIEQYALSFGGSLTRLETRLFGEGEGISATINGAYLLNCERHADMTSHVQLSSPDAEIRQSVKGVVTDKSRGVFQGKFHVERPAQHTDAEMRHDALMLSDRAQVRAKPELEIYADDVACAHGNTIGQLDDNALFYMRQRGIPVSQARALLTEAFVKDVFDDLADDVMRENLSAKVADWLRGTHGI